MDNSQLRTYFLQNMELLRNQNYDKLYAGLSTQDKKSLTKFLFEKTSRNPLDFMSSIPDGMFYGITIPTLVIPEHIRGEFRLDRMTCNKLIIEPNVKFKCNDSTFDSVNILDGVRVLQTGSFSNCTINKIVKLPKTLKTIEKSAFDDCRGSFIIATPKRDSRREQLVINPSDESLFREKLRWLRDKTSVESEQAI